MAATIGIDVGGTKAIAVVTVADGKPADRATTIPAGITVAHRIFREHSARGSQSVSDIIVGLVHECRAATGQHAAAVGLAIAGWLSPDRRSVTVAVNLGLNSERLPERVAARIGVPVLMENDGNAAAVAESRFGAANGTRVSMTLTIGTGVGGGVVVGEHVLAGGRGLAGEIGHLCVEPGGRECACGASGCLEAYASGPAILRDAIAAGLPSRTPLDVVAAARAGDATAIKVIAAAGQSLGYGIAQVCAMVDPEIIVVGGGVAAGAGALLLDPIRRTVADSLPLRAMTPPPHITAAICGADAGAVGAAALARGLGVGATTLARDSGHERSCR
jgi:glucokinase